MAGHNKWSQIKHKKAKTDAQKGKIFSKYAREIMMAAKLGGGDPKDNARLRLAIQGAKNVNMPNDNIRRAIEKGTGAGDDTNLEEVTFEAYGPNGIAILIDTLTDNRNRTVPNLRTILSKYGGTLAEKGSVAYLFDKRGLLVFAPHAPESDIMEIAMAENALDFINKEDGSIDVVTSVNRFEQIKQAYDEKHIPYDQADLTRIPQSTISVSTIEAAKKMLTLIEKIEDDDDVQRVYTNADIADDIFAKLDL